MCERHRQLSRRISTCETLLCVRVRAVGSQRLMTRSSCHCRSCAPRAHPEQLCFSPRAARSGAHTETACGQPCVAVKVANLRVGAGRSWSAAAMLRRAVGRDSSRVAVGSYETERHRRAGNQLVAQYDARPCGAARPGCSGSMYRSCVSAR